MSRSIVRLLRAASLVAVTLVLSHEAVFLARYGSIYGEALQHSGHGAAWSDAVRIVLLGATLLLAGALAGVYRLTRQVVDRSAATQGGARSVDGIDLGPVARRALAFWLVLAAAVLVLLTLQENLEHLSAGLGLPGIAILLSPEYPFAVVIALVAALGVALVTTLLAWRHEVLVRRLRALTADARPRARGVARPASLSLDAVRASILARRLGRRAPPALLTA